MMPAGVRLAAAAKDGDDKAFEMLLEPLIQPDYRLACGMLHDPQAAEDAVQEAAFKAWRKLRRLRDGTEMRPWFLGIVANECRTTRRSRWWSVLKALPEGGIQAPVDGIVSGLALRSTLRSLDHGKRLVLVLRWYLDLPLTEIASVAGLSVSAAESRLQRGVRELRERMGDADG